MPVFGWLGWVNTMADERGQRTSAQPEFEDGHGQESPTDPNQETKPGLFPHQPNVLPLSHSGGIDMVWNVI